MQSPTAIYDATSPLLADPLPQVRLEAEDEDRAIYTCTNRRCRDRNREFEAMTTRAVRFATGRPVSCGTCGDTVRYLRRAGDILVPASNTLLADAQVRALAVKQARAARVVAAEATDLAGDLQRLDDSMRAAAEAAWPQVQAMQARAAVQPTEQADSVPAPVQAASQPTPVASKPQAADGSITDHAFTPWKPAPTRCNTCGKVQRRHAQVQDA